VIITLREELIEFPGTRESVSVWATSRPQSSPAATGRDQANPSFVAVVGSMRLASMAIDPRALGKPPPTRMVFALDEKMMNLRRGVAGEVGRGGEWCRVPFASGGAFPLAENVSHTEISLFFAH
jgi:hypothetical protein